MEITTTTPTTTTAAETIPQPMMEAIHGYNRWTQQMDATMDDDDGRRRDDADGGTARDH
jgi:hypothetical protein